MGLISIAMLMILNYISQQDQMKKSQVMTEKMSFQVFQTWDSFPLLC